MEPKITGAIWKIASYQNSGKKISSCQGSGVINPRRKLLSQAPTKKANLDVVKLHLR